LCATTFLRAGQPAPLFITDEVKSRSYGDTVVMLIGKIVTEQTWDGKAVQDESRYTDTYVRQDRRWQVVASYLSNAPQAKPASPAK
jgi:hypothetical protein